MYTHQSLIENWCVGEGALNLDNKVLRIFTFNEHVVSENVISTSFIYCIYCNMSMKRVLNKVSVNILMYSRTFDQFFFPGKRST